MRTEPALPELRIGLATGPVLARYGDVFGEVVNIAARRHRPVIKAAWSLLDRYGTTVSP